MRSIFMSAGFAAFGLLASASGAQAQCAAGTELQQAALQTAVVGATLTDGSTFNETHNSDGSITEIKKGVGDPVDPTVINYATYVISTNGGGFGTIAYNYKSGYTTPPLTVVMTAPGALTFCNGTAVFTSATGAH